MYNPTIHTTTNKALGIAQGVPTDARSYFYDASLFLYRPYQSEAEVLAYLNLSKYRVGNFPIFINTGTLQSNGTFAGGIVREYWFKDCVADSCLIEKVSGGGSGGAGVIGIATSLNPTKEVRTINVNTTSGVFSTSYKERHLHTQSFLSAQWDITHGFDRPVEVTIYNNLGEKVFAKVENPNSDLTVIKFSEPLTGIALIQ